jgi:hypothetical protein
MQDLQNYFDDGFTGKMGTPAPGVVRWEAEILLRLRFRNANPFPSDTLNAYLQKNRKMVG